MHNFKTIPHVGFWIPSVLEALEKRLPWTKKAYRPSARVHGRMPWRRSINLTALHRTKPKLEFEPQDAKVEKEKQNHISDYPLLATSCSGIKTAGFSQSEESSLTSNTLTTPAVSCCTCRTTGTSSGGSGTRRRPAEVRCILSMGPIEHG